jgi:hypothetical protein
MPRPFSIKSPCEVSWTSMAGDDRTRFCGTCQKHVFNLSEMTAAEVDVLFAGSPDLCVRAMTTESGALVTKPCAEPAQTPASRRFRWLGVGAGAVAATAAWASSTQTGAATVAQLRAWVREDVLGIKPPPPPTSRHLMGAIDFGSRHAE